MTIGSRIKELREAANLTQDELAKKVGVTKSALETTNKILVVLRKVFFTI